jgi:hypothetical protein
VETLRKFPVELSPSARWSAREVDSLTDFYMTLHLVIKALLLKYKEIARTDF